MKPMLDVPPDVREALQAGKLEMTCPACGRWSAADWACSWCFRVMTPAAEWYRNGKQEQRAARMPTTAPANPPSEYRDAAAKWPKTWGPYPGQTRPKAVGALLTPVNAVPAQIGATLPIQPEIAA
jgi:hypothetical protein